MDETQFSALADQTLGMMMDTLDESIGDVAEVELQGGILTISLDDGRQYVVNKHAPNKQIWLSSPVSGAAHFDFAEGAWRSTRSGDALHGLLAAELTDITGVDIDPDDLS